MEFFYIYSSVYSNDNILSVVYSNDNILSVYDFFSVLEDFFPLRLEFYEKRKVRSLMIINISAAS